ncbi:putative membrane protein [Salibacterium salarium]|uniref:PH domain-containing protein n=1 Tax=Salibacterium salarium TaxID=284579 RepID=UPI002781258D|nr:PH domain-containing protein [Salibacterium salarium]MDQ0298464.1 putative membrane protein [Salibacterium salarium]
MNEAKRYHPLIIVYRIFKLLRNSFVFAFYLFVIKWGAESTFLTYGRLLFILLFGFSIVSIVYNWFTNTYKLDNASFHIYKGLFTKTKRTIPFSKIQNVSRHSSTFHLTFNVTSITFETSMADKDASVSFPVISREEADRIDDHIANPKSFDSNDVNTAQTDHSRTIHFTPTKKDIIRASFTSLSFLAVIPIMISLYSKINRMMDADRTSEVLISSMKDSWLVVSILTVVTIAAFVLFGIVRTIVKYGKYEISSDGERIHIVKGLINKTSFSILKSKVQAIEIKQSPIKRLAGTAEVKLTSAGSLDIDEDTLEVNSLYPFLPVQRAYDMISEILPSYEVTSDMNRLPKKSFWVRMLKPSWLWIISTTVLFYFKPSVLNVEQAWWIISISLCIIIGAARWLDYFHTQYTLNNQFIQLKTGSLTTTLFVSKRDKIIEVATTQNVYQKRIGLSSVKTINRAKPVKHKGVHDVPIELADSFYSWYMRRYQETKVE